MEKERVGVVWNVNGEEECEEGSEGIGKERVGLGRNGEGEGGGGVESECRRRV